MSIPVVYCFDRNYARCAAVSCLSAWRSASTPVTFHWIFTPDAARRAGILSRRLRALGVPVTLHPVPSSPFADWVHHGHFSPAAYLRLLIPRLVPGRRAIYIDGDTLVKTDLRKLHETDLQGALLAAVPDERAGRGSAIRLADGEVYVNSGVMVMDLEALRADGFEDRMSVIHARHGAQATYVDQCLINKYAEGRKRPLPACWNNMIYCYQHGPEEAAARLAAGQGTIMHFVGSMKPWRLNCNDVFARYWFDHAGAFMPLWAGLAWRLRLLNVFRPLARRLLRRS